MVDFGESNKMMKISGKLDKSDTYKGFESNISLCLIYPSFHSFFIIYIYIYIVKW